MAAIIAELRLFLPLMPVIIPLALLRILDDLERNAGAPPSRSEPAAGR